MCIIDVSAENLHQGFTRVFESTFESVEAIAEYVAHPTHIEYPNLFTWVMYSVKNKPLVNWFPLLNKWLLFALHHVLSVFLCL